MNVFISESSKHLNYPDFKNKITSVSGEVHYFSNVLEYKPEQLFMRESWNPRDRIIEERKIRMLTHV